MARDRDAAKVILDNGGTARVWVPLTSNLIIETNGPETLIRFAMPVQPAATSANTQATTTDQPGQGDATRARVPEYDIVVKEEDD